MDSDQIRARLQALLPADGAPDELVVDRSTFGAASFEALLAPYYPAARLVIRAARLRPPGAAPGPVVVEGKATLLNVEQAGLTATFWPGETGVELTLRYCLPPTWKFSQSFPGLPVSFDFRTPFAPERRSYLDLLTLTDAALVLSTVAHDDPEHGVRLEPGLGFVASLRLNGVLGGVEHALGGAETLTLHGSIVPPPPNPTVAPPALPPLVPGTRPAVGVNLTASLGVELALGSARLDGTYLSLYSPPTADWLLSYPMYPPGLFLGGRLALGERVAVDVFGELPVGGGDTLTLNGLFEGLSLESLADLAGLAGGADLLDGVGPALGEIGALSLEALSITLAPSTRAIDSVALTIGLPGKTWSALDGLVEVGQLVGRVAVESPLGAGRAVSARLMGQLEIAGVPLVVVAAVPGLRLTASLHPDATLPLGALLERYLPDAPSLGDLTVDQLYLDAEPGRSFTFAASLADEPHPWTVDLGPKSLTIRDVELELSHASGAGTTAAFSGTLELAGASCAVYYQLPGTFSISGQLPRVSLRALVEALCDDLIPWPGDFDVDFERSQIRIERGPAGYTLLLGSEVERFGSVAFEVQRGAAGWGFAAGMDLPRAWKLATIDPALAAIDDVFSFDKMLLVLSSIDDPAFRFPDLAAFNDPSIAATRIVLPPSAPGVVRGLNYFAELSLDGHRGLELVRRLFGLTQATLDARIQIGTSPLSATLSAALSGALNDNLTFSGALRAQLAGGEVAIGLLGQVRTTVHERPLTFTGEFELTPNGIFFAATMQGSWEQAFGLPALTLSDLALAIGASFEGIPTIGVAAAVSLRGFSGSAAILFDSMVPSRSMLAGGISDLTVQNVAGLLLEPGVAVPPALTAVLDQVRLTGVPLFQLPGALAAELDSGALTPAVAQAFASVGRISLPAPLSVLLSVDKAGLRWSLTDRTTLKQYGIERHGDVLQVAMRVQLYVVPQATTIGALAYPAGLRLAAALDCFGLHGSVLVDVDSARGIALDGTVTAIDLGPVFALTGHGGQGDPVVSLATYDAPTSTYRGPHCVVSGAVTLLGFTRDLDLRATTDGIELSASARIFDAFNATVTGRCPLARLASADFAVSATMDNDLLRFLKTRATQALTQAASEASAALLDLQHKAADAQGQVAAYQGQIAKVGAQARQARADQQATVQRAQNDVNRLQGTIDSNQREINRLQREIAGLRDDLSRHPWNFFQDSAQITAKGSEVAGRYFAIQGTQGSRRAAQGVLDAARRTLDALPTEEIATAGLRGSLLAAQQFLAVQQAALAGARQSVGSVAALGDWLAQNGPERLVDLRHAAFAGQLGAVSGGKVVMEVDLAFMDRPIHESFGFDFHDLELGVKTLVEILKRQI